MSSSPGAKAQTFAELAILESRCRHRERLPSAVGAALRAQLNVGVRTLFCGPSGTGKTLAARLLASVLMRGLVRDARLVRLRITMPDVSGSLAKVAALIAEAGGNIVEVQHQRIFGTASVRSPEVEFLVETRDREHTEQLVAKLRDSGIRVSL